MAKDVYECILGTPQNKPLSKIKALQHAMLVALNEKKDNPHEWGSFYLSGLP